MKNISKNYVKTLFHEIIKLNKFVDFKGENSLDKILQNTKIPTNFDFLSIDIDGCDYFIKVLNCIDLK